MIAVPAPVTSMRPRVRADAALPRKARACPPGSLPNPSHRGGVGVVLAAEVAGPLEHTRPGLFHFPTAVVFEGVVPARQVRQIVVIGVPVVKPVVGVIDVAPSGADAAHREPAGLVAEPEPSSEWFRSARS